MLRFALPMFLTVIDAAYQNLCMSFVKVFVNSHCHEFYTLSMNYPVRIFIHLT